MRRLPPLVLVGTILVLWEVGVRVSGASPIVLPGPIRVVESLWAFRADALRHAIPTLVETVLGLAVSVLFAVLAAVAMDRWRVVREAIEPVLVVSQTVPVVAIAPLFVIWFGFGLAPKVVVVVLVTFFPITIALLDGFSRVPAEAADLMRSLGASEGVTFRKLRWPAALPSLFTGLRIAVVYAVIGAVFGEYVGAREGLGIWMQLAQNAFRTDLVFAAILLSSTVSLGLYGLVRVVERFVIPWDAAARRAADPEAGRPAR